MKVIGFRLLALLGLTLLSRMVPAQNLLVYSGLERSVAGNQFGASLVFETKGNWAFGGFHQVTLIRTSSESISYTDPFYGLIIYAPIARTERLSFFATLRAGLVNDDFIVVVPSFETRIHLSSRMGFVLGAGFRHTYPSLSAKVFFTIF